MPNAISILSVALQPITREDLLRAIDNATPEKPITIATPNPEFILLTRSNPAFKRALEHTTFHSIDGIGLLFALKLIARLSNNAMPLTKYTGVDCMHDIIARYAHGRKRIAMIGGDNGAAEKKAQQYRERYPDIAIVYAERGGFVSESGELDPETEKALLQTKPDIVFVGFGAPKQELWIERMKTERIPVMIGVGGSFNFATTKKRAPAIVRKFHFEWLWRSLTEKGHFKRAWKATVVFGTLFLVSLFKKKA